MDALRRIAKASSEGVMWKAYVAARTLAEMAARAVVEAGLPRPERCEDLPRVLAGSVLDPADSAKLAEVLKTAKALHKTQDPAVAKKIADDAVELVERLARAARRRYPAVETREGVRYALKAAGVKAAYSIGPGELAVRADRPLGLEEKLRLAAELSAELGIPPDRLIVGDLAEPGTLERAIREGKLIYADDLDDEIDWLSERYIEYICC